MAQHAEPKIVVMLLQVHVVMVLIARLQHLLVVQEIIKAMIALVLLTRVAEDSELAVIM